jgi:hypothetical protein
MELTHGRLRAALTAGKIPVTDEALVILRAGLVTITHGYHLNKVLRGIKTEIELKKDLSRLYSACRTFVEVLDTDLSGLGQIESILSATWPGTQVARLVEELRLLSPRLEMAIIMAGQDQAIKPRRQNPVTWLFLAVHDLFSEITGEDEPGTAGPLHRFTKRCAALIDSEISVPENENSFHKRLTAALARRTGKIDVLPRIIFPGKQGPRDDSVFPPNRLNQKLRPLDITRPRANLSPETRQR